MYANVSAIKTDTQKNPRIWGFFSWLKMHESVLEYGCLNLEFHDFLYTTISISVLFFVVVVENHYELYVPKKEGRMFY